MTMSNETNNTTRPMTAEEYWKDKFPAASENNLVLGFADAYATYRLQFEQEHKPQPLDPFEGAPEWAEWRAADRDGGEHWYAQEPQQEDFLGIHDANGFYMRCPDRRLKYTDWRQSPAKRQR